MQTIGDTYSLVWITKIAPLFNLIMLYQNWKASICQTLNITEAKAHFASTLHCSQSKSYPQIKLQNTNEMVPVVANLLLYLSFSISPQQTLFLPTNILKVSKMSSIGLV